MDHYENFPVASWLCPPALRPTVAAIYHYARTADDLADEGSAAPTQRQAQLALYRQVLEATLARQVPPQHPWPGVFEGLTHALDRHQLPAQPLRDLLEAFIQDIDNPPYRTRADLLDYCRRSANPIGRLLLHLYGIHDAQSQARSDAVCTALQLINFWQDFSIDHPRGRCYIPHEDAQRHGLPPDSFTRAGGGLPDSTVTQALVRDLVDWAAELMRQGQDLPLQVPGRAGWELRLVVQGGLRILEKIERMRYRTLNARPTLNGWDGPWLIWRAVRMGSRP